MGCETIHANLPPAFGLLCHGYQYGSGVYADAYGERYAELLCYFLCTFTYSFLHVEGGVAGTQRMVLERHRRTETCHDSIAPVADHYALIAMNRVHHHF